MTTEQPSTRYRLTAPLGHGASGAVWRARDVLLDREVAVKRLPSGGGHPHDGGREARLAARVRHPHVVSVLDLVETDLETWVVMELVDGEDLAQRVKRTGALSPRETATVLQPVAAALAAAHATGVVHRDVKPSNILVSADERVLLTDFGVARDDSDASATLTGLVTGTPAYLAPEVATGERASASSDVWSLAATLVHLVTGRAPFHVGEPGDSQADAPLAVVQRVVNGPAPHPEEAGPLAPLLAQMFSHDPAARPSAAEVAARFSAVADGTTTQTIAFLPPPPGPPPAPLRSTATRRSAAMADRRLMAAAAAALVAVLVGAGVLGALTGGEGAQDAPTAVGATPAAGAPSSAPAYTADDLERFARDYVRTADADPAAGLQLLTPEYRARSTDYAEFWGPMRSPKILDVDADPAAMSVSYTYRYALPGSGRRTERVTLRLVDTAEGLRVADASAV